jgi:hypothetical protein
MADEEQLTEKDEQEFDEILVDHAVRCWGSERENANRLSSRSTLLLSALAALFGLGLFRIDWFRGEKDISRVNASWAVWAIKILLSLGLVLFGWAFVRIMGRKGRRAAVNPHSADLLGLPASIITVGPPVGDDARRMVFIRVYRAYSDLKGRNATRKKALDQGQQVFLLGMFLVAIALVLYIFASEPPRMGQEVTDGKPNSTASASSTRP